MLIIAGLMWLLDKYLPIVEFISTPWNNIGFLFVLSAFILDGLSVLQFFRVHTTINPLHPEKAEKLVITGSYCYSRNPMYMGLLFMLFGWGIVLGSVSPFVMPVLFIFIITKQQIIPEEKILEQKFGQQYSDYKNKVNRWL